ncbi:putative scaffolding protein [Rhizobium phage RHph_X3_9]|nr:putative scaffolding protein [Rhizobium phage RHph_X3_9]
MAGEAPGASQGAGMEHLSDGQTSGKGAPVAPEIKNSPHGDGVVPKEDDKKVVKPEDKAATEEDKAKEKTEGEDEEEEQKPLTEWSEFDDPSANAAISLLKEAGATPAQAAAIFDKAIESGNLADIDVKALEALIGKDKALLVMNGVRDYHHRTTKQNTETVQMVKDIFGGDAGWETVKTWAQNKEKRDPTFKKELDDIREDLNKGGRAAKAAAKDLLKLYNGAPNTKGLGNGNQVKGEKAAAPAGAPLSRADYIAELKKAHSNGASSAAIAQLDARRMAGKQAGI